MSINRREFLSLCVKGSVSAAALTSLQLQALTGATNAVELGDYKALVCVYLYGGNDSLNMLVPLEGEQRSVYEQSRQNLAVESPLELSIKSQFAGGVGIHPSLEPIQSVFEMSLQLMYHSTVLIYGKREVQRVHLRLTKAALVISTRLEGINLEAST